MIAQVQAFVRTDAGVVQLKAGDPVPDDADPDHVAELAAAGALGDRSPELIAEPGGDAEPAPVPAATPRPPASRGK